MTNQIADGLASKSPVPMGGRTPLEVLSKGEPEELQQLDDVLTPVEYGMHV